MIEKTTLANGLQVITEKLPTYRMVHAHLCFAAGSGFENRAEWGAAHFLEHLIMTGGSQEAQFRFACQMAEYGALVNAETDIETCSFQIDAPAEQFIQAFQLLVRHVQGFQIQRKRFEVERQIILEEIASTQWDMQSRGVEALNQAILGEVAHPVLGSAESLDALMPDLLVCYHERFFTPDRVVAAVVGNVEHEEVVRVLDTTFGKRPRGMEGKLALAGPPVSRRVHVAGETSQTHLFYGWPTVPRFSEEHYALTVALRVLAGDGTDSWARLFHRLRTKNGRVYAIGGFEQFVGENGLLSIYAEFTGEKQDVVEAVLTEIDSMQRQGISPSELARAVAVLRANRLAQQDLPMGRAKRLVVQALYGEAARSAEDEAVRLAQVSLEQVQQVVMKYFHPEKAVLVTVGGEPD